MIDTPVGFSVVRVNGVPLNTAGESLATESLRQRACTELLRQAAQRARLLDAADSASPDGVISEAAASAIVYACVMALRYWPGIGV